MSEIQHLDEFIEDLIHEKKPRVYEQDSTDPEMEKMFETIRAVKRLRKSNPAAKGFLNHAGLRAGHSSSRIATGSRSDEHAVLRKEYRPCRGQSLRRSKLQRSGEIRSNGTEKLNFRKQLISIQKP